MAGSATMTLKTGEVASQHIRAGIVVLSYFVSVLGSLTTLELLNKRTAGRGKLNWFLLAASSVSMGTIAIWSMHFIGNQAIMLANGEPAYQLMYSPAFTALSFFLPILVLSVAFFFAGANEEEEVSKVKVAFAGALAGLAICAMHYAGQFGVANYTSQYKIAHLVGSVVIAVVASVSALTLFFVLRSRWEGSFWKRLMCAFGLAAAVSGMHWVAATGTSYKLRSTSMASHVLSRDQVIIVVLIFSVAACAFLISFAIFVGARNRKSSRTSQKIVLLSVIFDNDGRLLVTTDGIVPSEIILDGDQAKVFAAFEDEFSRLHPVYQWLYRASRCWEGVKNQIELMQQHIAAIRAQKSGTDIGLLFREMFCVAAYNLAQRLRIPLEEIGVLYDDLLSTGLGITTGLTNAPATLVKPGRFRKRAGKGHTLIVYKKVDKEQMTELQAAGFRFAGVNLVLDTVAKPLQVPTEQLHAHLNRIFSLLSLKEEAILEPGVHVGCFATQKHSNGMVDIVVHNGERDLIPSFQMPIPVLPRRHANYLAAMEGLTMREIIQRLRNESFLHDRNKDLPRNDHEEEAFMVHFQMTIQSMAQKYKDKFILDSKLCAITFDVPCRKVSAAPASRRGSSATLPPMSRASSDEKYADPQGKKPQNAKMIVFRTEIPPSSKGFICSNFKLEPLPFYYTRQRCFSTSPDHRVLVQRSQEEFAEALEAATSADESGRFSVGNLLSSKRRGAQRLSSRRPGSDAGLTPGSDTDDKKDGSLDDAEMGRISSEESTWAEKVVVLTQHGRS